MSTRSADKTTELLEKKFKNTPTSRIFSRLADAHRKEGNISRAIELCLSGIQNHPDYSTGHLILGRCFYEQQNYSDAFEEFKKVCMVDRYNQIAIKMLADIFVHQGMEQKAGSLYVILLRMDPLNKAIQKLSNQYQPGDLTDIFDILSIERPIEQIIWKHNSSEQNEVDQIIPYSDSPSIINEEEMNQIGVTDNTIAIESESIDQTLSMSFDDMLTEESNSQLPLENVMRTDDTLSENISTNSLIDENADITGQDISSRIDELFSEPTEPLNNSQDSSSPELNLTEVNSTDNNYPFNSLDAISQPDENLISDSDQKLSAPGSIQIEPFESLIEQPQNIENPKSVPDNQDVLSELEETMQFDKSYLDNAIETAPAVDDTDKSNSFVDQNLIAEISEGQQISMDDSASDAFDPSQIIISPEQYTNPVDENQNIKQSFSSKDDLLIESDAQLFSAFQNQNLIDQEIIDDNSSSDTNIKNPLEIITDEPSSLLSDPDKDSTIDQIIKIDETSQNFTSQNLFPENSSDIFSFSDELPDVDLIEQPPLNDKSNSNDSDLQIPNNSEPEKKADSLVQDITNGFSLNVDNEENIDSISEEWQQLPDNDNAIHSDQTSQPDLSIDDNFDTQNLKPNDDLKSGTIQNNLEVIDITQDNSEINVEQDEDILTDMDVLVSDQKLSTVSGNDIVEKLDSLFPEENISENHNLSSDGRNDVEILSDDLTEENTELTWKPLSNDSEEAESTLTDNSEILELTNSPLTSGPENLLSNNAASNNHEDIINGEEKDVTSIISAQDIEDRLDQFFPSEDLFDSNSIMKQPDNNDPGSDLGDFYTIFGDNAQNGQPVDNLANLEKVELEYTVDDDKSVSFYDEWNDVCNISDQNENLTLKENIQKSIQKNDTKNITVNDAQNIEQTDQCKPYTIPDHVLTPTLADIYFQQGQPDLAIQIYTRLLSRDPDNENIQQKLKQISESLNSGLTNFNLKKLSPTDDKTPENLKQIKTHKGQVDNRPLAGVRIRKKRTNSGNRTKGK